MAGPPDGPAMVSFDGATYEAVQGSTEARLLVPRNAWTSHRLRRRVLSGRRVDD
jgi:hypothetical protein